MNTIGKDFKYKVIKNFLHPEEIKLLSNYCDIKHRLNDYSFDINQNNNGDSRFYGDKVMESLMISKKDLIEKETGKELLETYAYWRTYTKFAVLEKHTDRPSCEISVTVNINGDKTPWPIFMDNESIDLKSGDAAIYLGCEVEHWRDEFQGDFQNQVFLHYVDKNGINKEYHKDKRIYFGIKQ